jgi:hypothetical protein
VRLEVPIPVQGRLQAVPSLSPAFPNPHPLRELRPSDSFQVRDFLSFLLVCDSASDPKSQLSQGRP